MNERKYMKSAVPMITPGTKSGRMTAKSTGPRPLMCGSARPTRVALTIDASPTTAAMTRLSHKGSTHFLLRKSRSYHSAVKSPGMPPKGSDVADISASQTIGA